MLARQEQPNEVERHALCVAQNIAGERFKLLVQQLCEERTQAQRHAYAPASTVAARIAQVREASAAVYDGRRLRRRVGPQHALERDLRDAALASGVPVRADERTGAWPVGAAPWRRVIFLGAVDY